MPKARTIQFTKEGYTDLKKEYEILQKQRPEAVQLLKTAREMGDLSENAAYRVARTKLSSLDSRLRYLSRVLKNAQVQTAPFTGVITMGCVVTLFDGTDTYEYTIVGGYESDILKGKLSTYSPIGKALMGKKAGQTIIVDVPSGMVSYKITAVCPSA